MKECPQCETQNLQKRRVCYVCRYDFEKAAIDMADRIIADRYAEKAAEIYKIPVSEVTAPMRQAMKNIFFAETYGSRTQMGSMSSGKYTEPTMGGQQLPKFPNWVAPENATDEEMKISYEKHKEAFHRWKEGHHQSPIEKAMSIVNDRSEEKERMYGPFSEGMKKAAIIATELCNKELNAEDMYKILMALKLSRIAYHPGHDSLTDLIGYAEGLYNFKNNK